MASPPPQAGPSSARTADLDRFWHPPPASTARLPALRAALAGVPSPALRISRVAQLDASLLDGELENILHAPVKAALDGVRVRPPSLSLALLLLPHRIPADRLTLSLYSPQAHAASSPSSSRSFDSPSCACRCGTAARPTARPSRTSATATRAGTTRAVRPPSPPRSAPDRADEDTDTVQGAATDSTLSRVQKLAYTLLVIVPPYLHSRLQDQMLTSSWADEPLPRSWFALVDLRRLLTRGARREDEMIQWRREWKRTGWELLGVAERLSAVLGLANFLVFLYNGRCVVPLPPWSPSSRSS